MTREIGREVSAGLAVGIDEGKSDVTESVHGLADDLRDAWDQIKEEAGENTETLVDRLVDLYTDLKDRITDTLGALGNNIVDHFRNQREAAQDHADARLEIEQRSADDLASLQEDRVDTEEDALLDHNRKLQDIETEHNRALADLAADDAEGRAEIENNYREDMEDAATDYARRREDIERSYSDAVTEQETRREEALQDEEARYEESKQTLWDIVMDTVRNFLTGLREELMLKAAAELVEAIALSILLDPLAAQHYAAAAEYGAGALGLAIAGFEKGALFREPTLLPAHAVAEGAYPEAYIPLSPGVFSEIGAGIVNAMSSPASPQLAAAGAGFGGVQVDMRGLFDGATITVRDDHDITQLARETYDLWETRMRGLTKL